MQARVTILTSTGDTVPRLIGNTAILGRGDVHLRVDGNSQVSRYHAMLRCFNSYQYQIVDLGSRNGTFVGQTRVILPVTISDEAEFRLGGAGGVELLVQQVHEENDLGGMTMDAAHLMDVTLLVCELKGFDEAEQALSQSALAHAFGGWLRNAVSLIERHGGVVDKFVRHSVLAYWPASDGGADCQNALNAAAELTAYARKTEWPKPLSHPMQSTIVMHHGKVSLGMESRPERDAASGGSTVHATMKVVPVASEQPLPVVVTQVVLERLGSGFTDCFLSLGHAEVGGNTHTLEIFGSEVETG